MARKLTTKAVEPVFEAPILKPQIKEAMEEEMEGLEVAFDRAKILSGGGELFEIPREDLDQFQTVKEIQGIILDHHNVNGYWKEQYTGESNPPDCGSIDGKHGEGSPGGDCSICPLNRFGSHEDGRSKACKNMHRIYLLRSGEVLPISISLPPTSLKNFSSYMSKKIIAKGLRSYGIITRITLKRTKSQEGIDYSQAQFSIAALLDEKTTSAMAELSKNLKTITRKIEAIDDYIIQEENEIMDSV